MLAPFVYILLIHHAATLPIGPVSEPLGADDPTNSSEHVRRNASNWWYANIDHTTPAVRDYVPGLYTGTSPNYTYPVYFSVQSGDSVGFIDALTADVPNAQRDNLWLAGQPRVIYLEPGVYNLAATVFLYTDTVIIGDAVNPPTLRAASNFSGEFLICGGYPGDGDESGEFGNGGELRWSIMMKNLIFDTTGNAAQEDFKALSWRVAQNTALVNIDIRMPQGAHTGIWMGQGSAVSVSDATFTFGSMGLHYAGLQQATLKNMHFKYCTIGIQIDNGFTVNVFAPTFTTVGNPIMLDSGNPWVSVLDGVSVNSGVFFQSNVQYPNFMIENISSDNTKSPMVIVAGDAKVGGVSSVATYVYGNTYGANPVYQTNPEVRQTTRTQALAPNGKYPVLTAPQYPDAVAADVINLKDSSQNGGSTLYGDEYHDDTTALQTGLNEAALHNKIAYLPYGIFRVTQTITIPPGTRLVGNAWSTISGYGSAFADESNPIPIVQVGTPGSVGSAQIQDLRFTVGEALPGAIVLQVNMACDTPGDVAIFNSLVTVGGTRVSCSSEVDCRGAYIGLHLSSTSSAYIDNFWSWLEDHQVDDSSSMTRIAAKGGVLIEATQGTWLAGLASEHWWLYNLNHDHAANVFNSLFQSETNYIQGASASIQTPQPFTPTSKDPDFAWCDGDTNPNCRMTIAQHFNGGDNLFQYGAASWNFYAGNQETMNVIQTFPRSLNLYGLCDHEGTYIMRFPNGTMFGDGAQDGFGGSWGTLVADFTV